MTNSTDATTLREMAYCLSINEPDATMDEHLEFLQELARDRNLDDEPDAALSDDDATGLLAAHSEEARGDDDEDLAGGLPPAHAAMPGDPT